MNQAEKETKKLIDTYDVRYFLEENNTIDRWWSRPDGSVSIFYSQNRKLLWFKKENFVSLRNKYKISSYKFYKIITNIMKEYGIVGDYKITENIMEINKLK